jgi:F-type H+-transporting ATPase subunit epsilon
VANQLHVEVVSVEQKVWSGEADMLVARTTEGELGILAGHAPLLGQLAEPSQIRIRRPEGDLAYDVAGGFLSVDGGGVTVLAESCQPASAPGETH